jgi:hypothetical protein
MKFEEKEVMNQKSKNHNTTGTQSCCLLMINDLNAIQCCYKLEMLPVRHWKYQPSHVFWACLVCHPHRIRHLALRENHHLIAGHSSMAGQ